MRTPSFFKFSLVATTALSLAACGGGAADNIGGGLPDAVASPVVIAASTSSSSVAVGKSLVASVTSTSQPNSLKTLSWSISSLTAGAPTLTVLNQDCTEAVRSNNTINGITRSKWSCDALLTAPSVLTADAIYRVKSTGTDDKGNSSTSFVDISIAAGGATPSPLPSAPPVVTTQPTVVATSGTDVGLSCFATGGVLKTDSKYSFRWVIKSNPTGLALALTTTPEGSVTFKVPVIAAPLNITLQCRVSDDNLATTTSDTLVSLSPAAATVAVAGAVASVKTAYPSTVVTLDGSTSAAGGAVLFYQWSQTEGQVVALSNPNGVAPSFVAPITLTSTRLVFQLIAMTSTNFSQATGSETTKVAVYVDPLPPLHLTVSAASSVKSDVAVSLIAFGGSTDLLYYTWSQVSGPKVTVGGANTATASFIAPVVAVPTEFLFEARVSRKPIAQSLPSEITSSDVVVLVSP